MMIIINKTSLERSRIALTNVFTEEITVETLPQCQFKTKIFTVKYIHRYNEQFLIVPESPLQSSRTVLSILNHKNS
jgi:hypothetical protein